jgi:hypothetical protein
MRWKKQARLKVAHRQTGLAAGRRLPEPAAHWPEEAVKSKRADEDLPGFRDCGAETTRRGGGYRRCFG